MPKSSSRRSQSRGRSQGRRRSKSPKVTRGKQRAQQCDCPQGPLNLPLSQGALQIINLLAALVGTVGVGVMAFYLYPLSTWGWKNLFISTPEWFYSVSTVIAILRYGLGGIVLFTRCDLAKVIGLRYALLVTVTFVSTIDFGSSLALLVVRLILYVAQYALLVDLINVSYPALANNLWAYIAFNYLALFQLFPYFLWNVATVGQIALANSFHASVLIAWGGVLAYMSFLFENYVLNPTLTRRCSGRFQTVVYVAGVLLFAVANYIWLSGGSVAISELQSLTDGFQIVSLIYIIVQVLRIVMNVVYIFCKNINVNVSNLVTPSSC